MDEFALCWNNFQDNISTGFQDLLDRGDLVDITIAVEGRIIQAHKVVLAICSPYFQEIFKYNAHKDPIIILQDVSWNIMKALLQFMYQGEVNVKHTELQAFMKIAEMLQIKGLTTPNQKLTRTSSGRQTPTHPRNTETPPLPDAKNGGNGNPAFNQLPVSRSLDSAGSSQKRFNDIGADSYSMIYTKKLPKRSVSETNDSSGTHDMTNDSMENMTDEVFMPQISIGEQRFDLNNVKRENPDMPNSPQQRSAANSSNALFNYDYQNNSGPSFKAEFNNDLNVSNDFNNSKGSHMDIPAGGNITMLSSTSLLHGNCIFNRNNTVATQQGMKTYWLCKSYRITMCRARCITHQGRVISATGVHNHSPHMKNPTQNENCANSSQPPPQPIVITSTAAITPVTSSQTIRLVSQNIPSGAPPSLLGQNQSSTPHIIHQNTAHLQPPPGAHQMQHMTQHQPQVSQHMNHIISSQPIIATPVSVQQQPTAVIQNMMQNVVTSNNLMHQHHLATSIHGLTNIGPILNPLQHQHHVLTNIHPPPSLQITPVRAILPPQHQQPSAESPHTPHNHSSTPSSTVVVQTNPTITQSGTTQQNEDSNRHQQSDSAHSQATTQVAQQAQASNQQMNMQSIEMSHSHGTPNFKMEHI